MASGSATKKRSPARGGKTGKNSTGSSNRPRSSASRSSGRKPAAAKRTRSTRSSGSFSKALRGAWGLLAKGVGRLARAVGRGRELEPEHRRDGIALGLIAFAVVIAAGVWWHAAGPVGDWVVLGTRSVLGAGAVALPLALVAAAVAMMRSEPRPQARPRMVIGTLVVSFALLGLLHLFSGRPADPEGRMYAGGALGYVSGGVMAKGVTAWVAVPLLVLALCYGVLICTGTPVRQIPQRLRDWGVDADERARAETERKTIADERAAVTEADPAKARVRKPARRRTHHNTKVMTLYIF